MDSAFLSVLLRYQKSASITIRRLYEFLAGRIMQPSDFAIYCLIFIDAVLSALLYYKCCEAEKRCEMHRFFVPVDARILFRALSRAAEENSEYSTRNFVFSFL